VSRDRVLHRLARRLADERGMSALPVVLLIFLLLSAGGLGFDLYRLIVTRQTVVGIVDSAAIAGATAVDEERYFESEGEVVVLDAQLARERALASMASQGTTLVSASVDIAADEQEITVEGAVDMDFALLRLLLPTLDTARVQARASSTPRRAPPE
jgi:Flp pilus assembly protein TadG